MPPTPTPSAKLLQLLPEAVVQTDALWEITYLNPAWHKLTGHSVAVALGKSLLEFVHAGVPLALCRRGLSRGASAAPPGDGCGGPGDQPPGCPDRDHRGHRAGAGGSSPALSALAGNH